MAETLQSLIDRETIRELIHSYCRSVDRRDVALGHSIWHEDGHADYGEFYKGSGRGVIDRICESHAELISRSHQVTNIILEIDGDGAASESYVFASMRLVRDEKLWQLDVWARYLDAWQKREGRWGLVRRFVAHDHNEIHEVQNDPDFQARSCPEASDVSYEFLTRRSWNS